MMPVPVYLDNHATTRPDPRVVEAMLPYLTTEYGNAASRHHAFGWSAEAAVERARAGVAALIGAAPEEIVFTSGATESINLAVKGLAEALAGRGRHIVTTAVEHHAVLGSCRTLAAAGFEVTILPVDGQGMVHVDVLRAALRPDTILVSVIAAQNEVGTLQPVADIGAICRARGVPLHVDAAQAAGKIPVDVRRWHASCVSISAHKMYGPKGVGALFLDARLAGVRPARQMDGSGQERGLRAGTLNVPAIVGFGVAADIAAAGMEEERTRCASLRDLLVEGIRVHYPALRVNGHPVERLPNNASITFPGVHADRLLMAMKDVAASTGAACSSGEPGPSHVLTALGLSNDDARSTIRFGLGRFTTPEDIHSVVARIATALPQVRGTTVAVTPHAS